MKVVKFCDTQGDHSIPLEEAIKLQRSIHEYDHDDDALEDFLVVHWAWIVDE